MTTLRLPTLLPQNRGLGDLSQSVTRDRRADLTPRNDRPTFGDSLREAAKKRTEHAQEQRPEETEDAESTGETEAVADSSSESQHDDTDTEYEQPVIVGTVVGTVDRPVTGSNDAEQGTARPNEITPRTSHAVVTGDDAQGQHRTEAAPSEPVEGEQLSIAQQERSTTLTDQVVSNAEDSATVRAAGPTDQTTTSVVNTSAQANQPTEPSETQPTAVSTPAQPATSSEHQGREFNQNRQTPTQQQAAQVDTARSPQAASVEKSVTLPPPPSDQIAAGVQRTAERDHHKGELHHPRRDPAMARARQVQNGLHVEQMTGARMPGALQPNAVSDVLATMLNSSEGISNSSLNPDAPSGERGAPGSAIDRVVSSRIVRGLASMLQQRGGTMTMRLDPPELGQLRVQMSIARGVVNAQFTPTTQHAQQLIERNIATLRAALEGQGLNVERLTVQAPAPSSGQGTATTGQDANQSNSQAQQDADAGERESRGREQFDQRRDFAPFDRLVNAASAETFDSSMKETRS